MRSAKEKEIKWRAGMDVNLDTNFISPGVDFLQIIVFIFSISMLQAQNL
jgi:hypothetical protein